MTSNLLLDLLHSDGLNLAPGFTDVSSEMLYWLHLRVAGEAWFDAFFFSPSLSHVIHVLSGSGAVGLHGLCMLSLKGSQSVFKLEFTLQELRNFVKSVAWLLWLWAGTSGIFLIYPILWQMMPVTMANLAFHEASHLWLKRCMGGEYHWCSNYSLCPRQNFSQCPV